MSHLATLEPQFTANATQMVAWVAKVQTNTVGNTAFPWFATNSYNLGAFALTEAWLHADSVTSGNSFNLSVGTNASTYNNLVAGTLWTTNVNRFVQLGLVAGISTNAPLVTAGSTVYARINAATASAGTATVILIGYYTGVR